MYFCSICSRFSAERMHGPNVSGQRNRIYKFGKTKIDQRLMKYAMVSVDLLKQQDSTFQDISYVLLEKHGISLYQHICSFSLFFCIPVTSKFKLLLHPPQNRTLSTRCGKYDGSHKQRKDNPARMKFSMRPTKSTHTEECQWLVSQIITGLYIRDMNSNNNT